MELRAFWMIVSEFYTIVARGAAQFFYLCNKWTLTDARTYPENLKQP